jgi:glycosyltransferase involved in cell wall biosynthesis
MQEPLRIVHIVPGLGIGGAERMLQDVVTNLSAPDAVHIVVNLQSQGPMQQPLERAGARVLFAHLDQPIKSVCNVQGLQHMLRQLEPHVVHGWMYLGNLAALLAQKTAYSKAALVWGMHSVAPFWPHMGPRRRSVALLNRCLAQQADALVYVADASARAHAQAGFATARARVIAGGVDTLRFAPNPAAKRALRQRLGIAPDAQVLGMLARYHPVKAHDVLLEAAKQLLGVAQQGPKRHVLLVGEGLHPMPQALKASIPAQMRPYIHCLGAQSDTAPIIAGLDVCTLSSWQEALPKVLLEALAAGVLCVATDVGDVAPLLAGVGWVVPPGAPQMLAARWRDALDCRGEQAQHRRSLGRARVVSQFSQDRFASTMRALYQELAQGKQR